MLAQMGHGAVHVSDLPNGNRSTDTEVGAAADEEDRVVVSKDSDFRHGHLLHTATSTTGGRDRQREQYKPAWVVQHQLGTDCLRPRREQLRGAWRVESDCPRRTARSLRRPAPAWTGERVRWRLTQPVQHQESESRQMLGSADSPFRPSTQLLPVKDIYALWLLFDGERACHRVRPLRAIPCSLLKRPLRGCRRPQTVPAGTTQRIQVPVTLCAPASIMCRPADLDGP